MAINWALNVNKDISNNEALSELALKLFNKVIGAFEQKADTYGKTYQQGINGGSSYQFIMYGDLADSDLKYHENPNTDFQATAIGQAEKEVFLDKRPHYIRFDYDDMDTVIQQHDKRAYSQQKAIEKFILSYDAKHFVKAAEASFSSHPVAGQPGGNVFYEMNFGVDPEATRQVLDNIVTDAEEKFIPLEQLHVFVTPAIFNWMKVALKDYIVNTDYTNGSVNFNTLTKEFDYSGLRITKSTSLSKLISTGLVTGVAGNNNYSWDFTGTRLIAFHEMSIATLIGQDIKMHYKDNRAINNKEIFTMTTVNGVDWLNPNGVYHVQAM